MFVQTKFAQPCTHLRGQNYLNSQALVAWLTRRRLDGSIIGVCVCALRFFRLPFYNLKPNQQ